MSKTVLLVDDETLVVDIAKRKLEKDGFKILTAGNGQEALDVLENNKADLIILDIEMPVMNGYTFLFELEKKKKQPRIPIIVLTAYNFMEPIFKRHNIIAYLLKPLKLDELLDKIKKILGAPAA